jgi:hypothetical protein
VPLFRRPERVPPLPAQVRAGLALPRGERVLAHGVRADGGWALATTAALVLVDPVTGAAAGPGTPRLRRLWHDVAEATWDPETRTIDVRFVEGSPAALQVLLGEPEGRLPEVLRERVMSTYVLSQRLTVRGRRGVTVAVRRHSVDGSLFTQTVPDEGIDAERPQVADQVQALTRDLAEQAGLVT